MSSLSPKGCCKESDLISSAAVRELGMTAGAVGRKIDLTQSAVSRAVQRGEKLASEMGIVVTVRNA